MSAGLAGIDVCYFRLLACIDDADTGHAAMVFDIVIRYLKSLRKDTEGKGEYGWCLLPAGKCK
ncbi:ABC transporter with duplicated ATPase [Apiospora saccharicola]|uniref:ABC transporter with duplicated ATPase n=1 Tax=Apiospora saccharicola TaxID=335842 RepID=A0ABR1UED9_9PEZI